MKTWFEVLIAWAKCSRYHRFEIGSMSSWGADCDYVELKYDSPGINDGPRSVHIGECGEVNSLYWMPCDIIDDFGDQVKTKFFHEVVDDFGFLAIESNNYYYESWKSWLYGFNVGDDFDKMIPFALEKFYEHFGKRHGVTHFDYRAYQRGEEVKFKSNR